MKTTEEMLTRVLNTLAENFREKLVLKGGMLLRLYNSPRSTQDLDFVVVTKESRKLWKEKIVEALNNIEGIKVGGVDLNSRGIFIDIESKDKALRGLIEISIVDVTGIPTEPVSTAPLSQKYFLSPQVIRCLTIPEAFAHKIAATLERDAVRDLYDLSQMEAIGMFDVEVLKSRLKKLCINRAKPKPVTFSKAAQMLRNKADKLNSRTIETDLYPFLPAEYRPGVLNLIRAAVSRVVQRMGAI